ncbi:MAG: hypothetical protein H0W90_08755 [Actinobacteria bacterium]|nr:hypothetical protein [Actinomycetota bacterium]
MSGLYAEFDELQRIWDTVPEPDELTTRVLWHRLAPNFDAEIGKDANREPRHLRRWGLLVAALLIVALATGSALALTGHLKGLFGGSEVRDLSAAEQFNLSEMAGAKARVTLIASRNGQAFYVIKRKKGGPCYAVGAVERHLTPAQLQLRSRSRFGAVGCPLAGGSFGFPSKVQPILDFSVFFATRDRIARLARLEGFAADPVAKVGVIGVDNKIAYTVDARENTYLGGHSAVVAHGIVALDKEEKPLFVQCTVRKGCGKYRNPVRATTPSPAPPARLRQAPPPAHPVSQGGAANGASVTVHGIDVELDLSGLSPKTKHLLEGKRRQIGVTCFKFVRFAGKLFQKGKGVQRQLAPTVRIRYTAFVGDPGAPFVAPFDGCTVTGEYGHTWNDSHGTHDAVEIPLTARGRRFFTERAVARDLAWLARARVFKHVRYANPMPAAADVAAQFGGRVVALPEATSTPPIGRIGLWTGPGARLVLVERTPTGRRLFLDYRHGQIYKTNFAGLTQIL